MEERNRKWEAEREDRKAETKRKEAEFELKKMSQRTKILVWARVKFSVMRCSHLRYV